MIYEILDLLEAIIKSTLPMLIIGYALYYIVKMYLDSVGERKELELRANNRPMSFPLRMQAYERLALFCERISLGNLILRVRDEQMTATDLRLALMVSIQQEYEHNVAQQIYVSEKLWQIVTFAKNDTIKVINLVAKTVPEEAGSLDLTHAIFKYLDEVKQTALDTARSAVSQEAATQL